MKNFNSGFTLAEVLVTLMIIGVVASLTLPALSVNSLRQQAATALAKAINTLESANEYALHDMSCRDLFCGKKDEGLDATLYLADVMQPYIELDNVNGRENTYKTKDGIYFTNGSYVSIVGQGGSSKSYLYGKGFEISVDVNGAKGPNQDGKDIFYLYVDRKGTVFAQGSDALVALGAQTSSWRNRNCDSQSVTTPNTCAGSIVDNGYRVIYKL